MDKAGPKVLPLVAFQVDRHPHSRHMASHLMDKAINTHPDRLEEGMVTRAFSFKSYDDLVLSRIVDGERKRTEAS
jgi:hypothetical protein